MQAQKRIFDPYERNQLYKYGLNPDHFSAEIQEPVEYLTGHVNFRGLDFLVTKDVLIPRVETEELVTLVLKEIEKRPSEKKINIAEVGTGSGVLGLSLAVVLTARNQDFDLTLSDISKAALAVAQKNQAQLRINNIHFIHSDLLQDFPPQKFHLMIANLPYIPSQRISTLEPSVKNYEPLLALDGGLDGLDVIRRLSNQAPSFLNENGLLFLEVDETHTLEKIQKVSSDFEVTMFKDSFGKNRFARLEKK